MIFQRVFNKKGIVKIQLKIVKQINAILLILFLFSGSIFADIRLPKLISNGMVIQRDMKVHVWGWADSMEKITITFDGKKYKTISDKKGDWSLNLPPHPAGGSFNMILEGNNRLEVKDILFGDVWLCSGQSNMELSMRNAKPLYEEEIKLANNQMIRCFTVPQKYNFKNKGEDYLSGTWQSVTPLSILKFSAVAYFFGTAIFQKYHVPIGLINASLGGSPIQAWMSEKALEAFPDYLNEAKKFRNDSLIHEIELADKNQTNQWYTEANNKDAGHQIQNWKQPLLNDSDWLKTEVPGYWNETPIGNVNGVVWFRKEFNISKEESGESAFLNLGRIVDADSVFINGKFIGTMSSQYPPRWYNVPENILIEGKNIMVVRIVNNSGKGGFVPDKTYQLTVAGKIIDLKGKWKMKLGCIMPPMAGTTSVRCKPMGLYNAMISPMLNYKLKGAIWYQGESNTGNSKEYGRLLPALINDWRTDFDQKDLPFLYVQLPNFMEAKPQPTKSNWALMRESQLNTLSVPNTGMAVAIDAGEWNDIHPLNKKVIGDRLAKLAEKTAYKDKKVCPSAPKYKSMKIVGNRIELTFTKSQSNLTVKDRKTLKTFAIAGNDKKFVWANAEIHENKIIVWNKNVQLPVAVRYAWADNPEGANLTDMVGNFASPFRTDNW